MCKNVAFYEAVSFPTQHMVTYHAAYLLFCNSKYIFSSPLLRIKRNVQKCRFLLISVFWGVHKCRFLGIFVQKCRILQLVPQPQLLQRLAVKNRHLQCAKLSPFYKSIEISTFSAHFTYVDVTPPHSPESLEISTMIHIIHMA